jgi:hypothetical protein
MIIVTFLTHFPYSGKIKEGLRDHLAVCVSPLNTARQRLGKQIHAATNTPATTEELLDAVFSIRSV